MLIAYSMTNSSCVQNSFKLWFVVNTDLTITNEKLMELFATVKEEYIDTIGQLLDLPHSKSKEVKRSYKNPTQKKEAYLDLYLNDYPCPSWRQVAKVLRGVDHPHQADVVESTYVQGTDILIVCLVTALVVTHDQGH